ncbi:MAG: hypothetical protein AAF572_18925 [Cyanobacteria bacterium P01_B01_bin.77]
MYYQLLFPLTLHDMLSTLSQSSQTALVTLFVLRAKGPEKIKQLLETESFGKVYTALSTFKDLPFSEENFIHMGMMKRGLQNAHFLLIALEAKNDSEAIKKFQEAVRTHCWGKIAAAMNEKLTDKSLSFSGSDLHCAHNPSDKKPCLPLPGGLIDILDPIIGAGMAVGAFFSQTLPDFFENDFVDFFVDDVAHFFTEDVAGFFKSLGEGFIDGVGEIGDFFTDDVGGIFIDFGDVVIGGIGDIGEDVGDFFGGLF